MCLTSFRKTSNVINTGQSTNPSHDGLGRQDGNLQSEKLLLICKVLGKTTVESQRKKLQKVCWPVFQVYILVSTYSILVAIVFFVIGFFTDNDAPVNGTIAVAKSSVIAVMTQLKRERQIFLAPLNIYTGVSISFILLDYSQVQVTHCLSKTFTSVFVKLQLTAR